ncbi:MAG: ERCC4 domain-containing protein [Nitrososphaerota archaeon]
MIRKTLIVVDANEASENSKMVESLRKVVEVAVRPLEAGDYLILGANGKALVERKRIFDFLNSLKGRLWDQLTALKSFDGERLLILEGYLGLYRKSKWNEAAVLGLIDRIVVEWEIPIIPTPDVKATLTYLVWKHKKLGEEEKLREYPLRVSGREMTPQEQALYTLEGLCGHKTAKALLTHFKTLGDVIALFHGHSIAELESMLREVKVGGRRIPSTTIRRMHTAVNTVYTEPTPTWLEDRDAGPRGEGEDSGQGAKGEREG